VNKVRRKESLLDCFAPYEYYGGSHSKKSIHIGHKCPLTGYHYACPSFESQRYYDCLCESKFIRGNPWRNPWEPDLAGRECSFVHLSTNKLNYMQYKYSGEDVVNMRKGHNELWHVIND
jgi:hypothetical protein